MPELREVTIQLITTLNPDQHSEAFLVEAALQERRAILANYEVNMFYGDLSDRELAILGLSDNPDELD